MCEHFVCSNYTELERMPRENGDDDDASFENLDGPYQRLQARYGSWKNQSPDLNQNPVLLTICYCSFFYLQNQNNYLAVINV